MNIKYFTIALTFLLSVISLPSHAGNIYRFLDKNGVSTLSKVLPPYAAQQGYDILDDKSFRLIERVKKVEELIESQKEEARLAKIEASLAKIEEDKEKSRLERFIHDRSLLDRYPDDRVMLRARDADLTFINKQIDDVAQHKVLSIQKLHNLQQSAAEEELAGKTVSSEINKQLDNARKNIENDQLQIERLYSEYNKTVAQYDTDLARIRELLHLPTPSEEKAIALKPVPSEQMANTP